MKRFLLLFLTLTCAAVAQVKIDVGDIDWPNQSASQLFRRNAANNGFEFFTASPQLTLTGDATGTTTFTNLGNGSLSLTLANSGVSANTYGSVTQIPQFTVDAKGRITGVTLLTASPAVGSITGLGSGVANALAAAPNSHAGFAAGYASMLRGPVALGISNGTTANRAIVQSTPARATLTGAAVATWRGLAYVPETNPSTGAHLFTRTSSYTEPIANWSMRFVIETDGALSLIQEGALASTDIRKFRYPGFVSAYAGQWVLLEIYLVNGTTNPVVRVNDVDISSSFTTSTLGTPPDWLPAALVDSYTIAGYNWPAGPVPLGCWLNAALTDTDRSYWRTTGQPPKWIVDGGNQVSLLTLSSAHSYGASDANATTGLTGTFSSTMSAEAGARTDGAGSFFARATATGTIVGMRAYQTSVTQLAGSKVRIRFWAKASVAGTYKTAIVNASTGSNCSAEQNITLTTSWQEFSINFQLTVGGVSAQHFGLGIYSSVTVAASDTLDIDDLSLRPVGALSLPQQGPDGYMLDGTRQSPANIATFTGIAWNEPLPVGTRKGITRTFAHSDISSTAATTLGIYLPPNWAVKEVHFNVAAAFDAAITCDIGISGTPAAFVSAQALSATGFFQAESLYKRVISSGESSTIYVKKSGVTTQGSVTLTFVVERVF